jgi:hypothetical protein
MRLRRSACASAEEPTTDEEFLGSTQNLAISTKQKRGEIFVEKTKGFDSNWQKPKHNLRSSHQRASQLNWHQSRGKASFLTASGCQFF